MWMRWIPILRIWNRIRNTGCYYHIVAVVLQLLTVVSCTGASVAVGPAPARRHRDEGGHHVTGRGTVSQDLHSAPRGRQVRQFSFASKSSPVEV